MSSNKGKASRRSWESPHTGLTQGFPLIHYDPLVPISKDLIDAAISWVMATYKYIHEGMDGKSPRFNILSKKPTREKLLAERAAFASAYPNLDELDLSMKAQGREYFEVGTGLGEGEHETMSTASSSSGSKMTKLEESDFTKELEIKLSHWVKLAEKIEEYLQNLFGVIRGNQTAESKDAVEKDVRWRAVNNSKDGILLWLLILRTHSVSNQHQPDIAMTAAEKQYDSFRMTSGMNLLQLKNGYLEKIEGLRAAGAVVPDSAKQVRHFFDKLDLSRYGTFVRDLHNGVYAKPSSLEEAFVLVQSKVSLHDLTKSSKAADSVPTFTSLAIESSEVKDGDGKRRKSNKKKDSKDNGAKKVSNEKKPAAKSEPTKSSGKSSNKAKKSSEDDKKSTRGCFGCGETDHILRNCPEREKVIAAYVKKSQAATSMTVVEEDEPNVFMSWPMLDEDDDDGMPELRDDQSDFDDDEEDAALKVPTVIAKHGIEFDVSNNTVYFPQSICNNVSQDVIEDYNADQEAWESMVLDAEVTVDATIDAKVAEVEFAPELTIWQRIVSLFAGVLRFIVNLFVEVSIFVTNIFETVAWKLSLAAGPLSLNSLLLDTGSNIHLTPNGFLRGLWNIIVANPPFKVKGVGHGAVSLDRVGQFLDIGPMYIGKAPCTIISVGLATENGARIDWAEDMSTATMTTRSGTEIVFKRHKQVWICNDYDSKDVADVLQGGTSMVTEAEKLLKYNRHELKQADEAAEYLKRLRYPGRGTAKSIVTAGALRNLPVTTKGLNVRFDIVGQELAAEQGGRRKSSPKLSPEIVNETITSGERSSILYLDLFFLNKFAFLLGAFYVPYSERAVYVQQFLSKGKGVQSIVAAITGFVGVMRSNKVAVELIQCDMESAVAAAKPTIESSLNVKVQQIGDNVAEIERGIGSVKMVCRKVKASLPFNLYGIMFVFLVAWAVSGLNLWTSPNFIGKLSPREALTGRKPDAARELNASFCDYLRTDATNAEFTNNLDSRAVEALALTPLGNDRGEWYCLSLETFRVITRTIRPGDIVPTPTRIINLMNTKAAKWSQDLQFSTRRGLVPDMQDVDVLQDVPTRLEDRSGDNNGIVGNNGAGNDSNIVPPMVGAPADIVINEDSSAGVRLSTNDSEAPLQIVDESPTISLSRESMSAEVDEGSAEFDTVDVAEEPTPTPTLQEPTSSRIRSPLPYNSNQRPRPTRGARKIDSLQSLTKSSLYVSKRDDDIGRAYSFHMSLLLKGTSKA